MVDDHYTSARTATAMRMERIQRLLYELRYEVERGFMDGEIDESLGYEFIVPLSREIRDGVVLCRFTTRPVHRQSVIGMRLNPEPRLKIVRTGDS